MAIEVGSAYISILPDTSKIAKGIRSALGDALKNYDMPAPDGTRPGKKTADQFAGEFDKVTRTKIAAALKSLPDAEIKANSTAAERKIAALRQQLVDMSDKRIGIDVSDEAAKARLDAVLAELKEIDTSDASASVRVNAKAAIAELAAVEAELDRIDGRDVKPDVSGLKRLDGIASQTSLTLGQMAIGASTLGSALIPVTAAAGGLAAALAAPLAIAGGGATLFGILAGGAVKSTLEQGKAIDKARTKLAGLEKGTKEYAEAQKDLQSLLKAQTPASENFIDSIARVKQAMSNLIDTDGDALLGPLSKGLRLVARIMPKLSPVIRAVSGVLDTFLNRIAMATKGPGFKSFIQGFARLAGPTLEKFGLIFENVFRGVFGLLKQFAPLGFSLLDTIHKLSIRFREFGEAKGSAGPFIDYLRKTMPLVRDTLGEVGKAAGRLIAAFAPIGTVVLKLIKGLAKGINALPVPVLTAGIAALVSGLIAWKTAMAAVNVIQKTAIALTTVFGTATKRNAVQTKLFAAAQKIAAVAMRVFGVAMRFAMGPAGLIITAVAAIGAGLVLLYKKNETFRKIVNRVWSAVKKAISATWNFIKTKVWPGMQKAFRAIGATAKWLWDHAIKPYFKFIVGQFRVMAKVGKWLWQHVISPAFKGIGKVISWAWNKIIKPVFSAISKVLHGDLSGAFNDLKGVAANVWNAIVRGVKAVPGALGNAAGAFLNAGKKLIGALWDGLKSVGGGALGLAKSIANGVIGFINSAIDHVNDGLEIDMPGPVPDINPPNIPHIPKFATGAHVTSATYAMIGEGREAESVLPDSVLRGLLTKAHSNGANGSLRKVLVRLAHVLRDVAEALKSQGSGSYSSPDTGGTSHSDRGQSFGVPKFMRDTGNGGGKLYTGTNPFKAGGNKGGGFLQQQTPKPDFLKKTAKGVKRDTVGMELAVGKSAKKIGKYWTTVRKKDLPSLQKRWHSSMKSGVIDAAMLDKGTAQHTRAIGNGFARFRKGPLKGFSDDWSGQFRSKTPSDVKSWRDQTLGHFGKARDGIRHVWGDQVKPVLRDFGAFPKKSVAPMFGEGTKAIGDAWSKITKRTGKPIAATISGPLNDGLVKAFNKIAKFVDADKFPKIDVPKFATGGGVFGAGTATSDSIPAMLSNGEHVLTAQEVQGMGGHGRVEMMRAAARKYGVRRRKGGKVETGYHAPVPYGGTYPIDADDAARAGVDWAYDIPVPSGTPVSAAWPGRISVVADEGNTSYGKWIEIAHHGFETRYAHLSQQIAHVGQVVKSGMLIGRSGNTGGSSGPHLHFEGDHGAPPIGAPSTAGPFGSAAMPKWVQAIVSAPKKWAKGLLQSAALKGTAYGEQSQGFLNKLAGPIGKWASDKLGPAAYSGPMSGSVTRFVPIVKKVLTALGEKSGPTLMGAILARMQKESGGNVGIVNNWDSNAAAGTPSVGLMQVIGPTYQANKPHPDKGPYKFGTSIDPYSNIYAGLHYARGRYGSIYEGMTQPGGYKDGGWLKPGEVGFNETRTPEMVFNLKQWRDIRKASFAAREGTDSRRVVGELTLTPDSKAAVQMWAAQDRAQDKRHGITIDRQRNGI